MSIPQVPRAPQFVEYSDRPLCLDHAFFLHSLPGPLAGMGLVFLQGFTIFITIWIRGIAGISTKADKAAAAAASSGSPSSADATAAENLLPRTTDDAPDDDSQLPPPYEAATDASPAPATQQADSTSTSRPQAPLSRKLPRPSTSAERFVLGSLLFTVLLLIFTYQVFCIQVLVYCTPFSPAPFTVRLVLGLFITPSWLFGTTAAAGWAMLLRDLWGPAARRRFPIDDKIVLVALMGVLIAVCVPFVLVGKIAVDVVQRCQRRFCGDALEDEEAAREDIEMGGGEEAGEASGSGGARRHGESSVDEEETVGLMKGMST